MFMTGRNTNTKCSPTDCCFGCFTMSLLVFVGCCVALYWLTHTYIREDCVILQMESCIFVSDSGTQRVHPFFEYTLLVQPVECDKMNTIVKSFGSDTIDFDHYHKNCTLYYEDQVAPQRVVECYWMEDDTNCDVTGTVPPMKSKITKDEPDDMRQIGWCIGFMVVSFLFVIVSFYAVIVRECGGYESCFTRMCKRKSYNSIN
uniref:Uncharacterized protein n=1 Tax=Clandestinovirus TaxID=2831644 RepID=A0A8F8KP31_9VIRU|nr:hypothetical protein KOM_12_197 [Clandestinovirus]